MNSNYLLVRPKVTDQKRERTPLTHFMTKIYVGPKIRDPISFPNHFQTMSSLAVRDIKDLDGFDISFKVVNVDENQERIVRRSLVFLFLEVNPTISWNTDHFMVRLTAMTEISKSNFMEILESHHVYAVPDQPRTEGGEEPRAIDPRRLHMLMPQEKTPREAIDDLIKIGPIDHIIFYKNMRTTPAACMIFIKYLTEEAVDNAKIRLRNYSVRPGRSTQVPQKLIDQPKYKLHQECGFMVTALHYENHIRICKIYKTITKPSVHRFCNRLVPVGEWERHLTECNPKNFAVVSTNANPEDPPTTAEPTEASGVDQEPDDHSSIPPTIIQAEINQLINPILQFLNPEGEELAAQLRDLQI